MTTIAIFPERREDQLTIFSAVIGAREATGRTAGEALDKLTSQLNEEETGTMVIVQQFRPDRFFSAAQRDRLNELQARWRAAQRSDFQLPAEEQAELERLVDDELRATTERSKQILLDSEIGTE